MWWVRKVGDYSRVAKHGFKLRFPTQVRNRKSRTSCIMHFFYECRKSTSTHLKIYGAKIGLLTKIRLEMARIFSSRHVEIERDREMSSDQSRSISRWRGRYLVSSRDLDLRKKKTFFSPFFFIWYTFATTKSINNNKLWGFENQIIINE